MWQVSAELIDQSGEAGTLSKQVLAIAQEITMDSAALNEANGIINAISAQTNLLAMNAAIEAAHAGEAQAGGSQEVTTALQRMVSITNEVQVAAGIVEAT